VGLVTLIQDDVHQHVVNYLRSDFDQQDLAADYDAFIARRWRRQMLAQIHWQGLHRDTWRQGFATSEILFDPGRQPVSLSFAGFAVFRRPVVTVLGADDSDLIIGKRNSDAEIGGFCSRCVGYVNNRNC
jgi:hypothetical protein